MATITTPTYLDGGTARTAGEAWTINGGELIVRTDTRWHANAPAGMLGSLGAVTISATLGGKYRTESGSVRWMAYNSGTGNVPAIGATVSQGGVSGYLLGVWASETSAPSAVGSAMPTTGFLKFREVTGGNFAVGALTGIGASATEVDRVGWIEVVHDQAIAITVPRLGEYVVNSDNNTYYYELGTTSGTAQQVVQIPTNGGGAGTLVPAIQIETGVGTGQYEWYPAVSTTYFNTTNLGTDDRCKFVFMGTNGQVIVGGNGTVVAGYLPPAGRKIRVPNVFQRNTTSANRALNLVPNATLGTRPDFTTTSAGAIRINGVLSDWYFGFTAPYNVTIRNSATMDTHVTSNEASPTLLDNYCLGVYNAVGLFSGTNNPLGGTIRNCKFYRGDAASNGHSLTMTGCSNYNFEGTNETGVITYARTTGACIFNQCRNFKQTGTFICQAVTFTPTTSANFDFERVRYIDRLIGTTNATTGKYAIQTTVSSDNIMVRNIDFGGYANVHPYAGVINASNCTNLTFRNLGNPTTPLGGATNAPAYIFQDSGNNDGVRVQNMFLTATRTAPYVLVNTSKNITLERLVGTVGALATAGINTLVKGNRATSVSVTGQASVYGTHWFDAFLSDTSGRVWLAFNEPTAFSADQYQAVSLGTGAGFTSGGQLVMPNVGDEVIWTCPYFIKGHTALANSAPVLTGTNTGNFTITYDIDTGTGFSGTYKTLNATNLSGETISSTTGFRLKIKVVTATANTGNALTYIQVLTTSTALAQNFTYPLDYATINISGLVAGSRVQLYDTTNNVELYNGITGTSLSYSAEYVSDFNVRVRVMYQSGITAKKFLEFSDTVNINGLSRSVAQDDDDIYILNAIDGSTVTSITIDDGLFLVNVNTGTISLQEIYAYETHWLSTEEGIRDETRFIVAVDQANYVFENFKIKNIQTSPATLVISGGYMKDSTTGNAIDVIDTTGGTIFLASNLVVPFTTSGGGGGGGDTKEDIYTYFTTSGRQNTFRADVSGLATQASVNAIPTTPLLASDTRLNNLDAPITSRLATASYTAPDNASIASILEDTGTTGVILANNSITSSVVANNAFNNSSFTTGYYNSIGAEVDDSLATAVSDIKGVEDKDLTEVFNNTPSIDPASVWTHPTRTLTESAGLTTEQATQLSEVHTNVDIKSSEIRAGGGGGFSSQALQTSISNAKREIIEKITEIPKVSLENIENKINEIDSHIELAKTDVIDKIESNEIEICSDIIRKTKELKEDNVKTRNLVRQKTQKIDENVSKLADRQAIIDETIEHEADEIESEIDRIINEEADMIEDEIYNMEADEIENAITNQSNDGNSESNS